MVFIGAGGYYPKKYKYRKKIVKAPVGWRVWFSTPTDDSKSVKIVFYKDNK